MQTQKQKHNSSFIVQWNLVVQTPNHFWLNKILKITLIKQQNWEAQTHQLFAHQKSRNTLSIFVQVKSTAEFGGTNNINLIVQQNWMHKHCNNLIVQ